MKTLLVSIAITLAFVATSAHAAAPATAPAGTTGLCKDGTWYSGASKKGACHGHQGVKEWYGAADASGGATSSSSAKSSPASTASSTPTSSTTSKTKHEGHAADTSPTASTASPPAAAPAGSTGLCNDGTYYSGASKKGACHGHKGVKTWYGTGTSTASATPAPAAMPASTPATMPTSTPAMPAKSTPPAAPAATPASHTSTASTGSPAPGGGAGKVWVNSSSKVYHCPGDRYYGTTKSGEYMSESDAVAKGNRPAHGKACSS